MLFLKGITMGVANVIPGVSGGTIALITEIYEDLINSLKSFDLKAVKLLLTFKFKDFIVHTNLYFLMSVFGGSLFSMFSIAKLFQYLFEFYPEELWSFFFGLILASVFYVGLRVKKWKIRSYIFFIIGTSIAITLALLSPSSENTNLLYIFLLVFILGSVVGLFGFSHVISWLFKRFKDCVLSLLTGFILGSLLIIWPWKIIAENKLITSWYLPELNSGTIISIVFMLIGFYVVVKLENFSKNN